MKINHFNHGMYSSLNKVSIQNIKSDVEPTVLSANLSRTESNIVSVASTSQFTDFEGIPVNNQNKGYIKIGNEIIEYNGVGIGVLTIVPGGRSKDNTVSTSHVNGSVVTKHEISGVSIRRLEVIQNIASSPSPNLDDYHIVFDRSSNGKDRSSDTTEGSTTIPQLSFNQQSLVGGSNVRASQNILYGALIPR